MIRKWMAAVGAALVLASFVTPMAQADSIAGVEAARAKLRTGSPLTPRDRAMLRRYGTSSGRDLPGGRIHRYAPNGGY
ncbi:hypothetical protein [Hyphomicrobium sp.]|uniref:hypothetical protein n=1 Tax=Hyphomicrobium sp. TaxID=82 RepID=UPI000FB55FB6|nr:hypothetical protein [Hyphomicrobium sp.]RUP09089.1 MAG: hypothetical protein EKK38_10635 [Hyphomicrobium sp.]